MVKIIIEIESCKKCPHFKTTNECSSDGFDRMEDWICTKIDKKIQGAVEWHEEKKIEIPSWCPYKQKESLFCDCVPFGSFFQLDNGDIHCCDCERKLKPNTIKVTPTQILELIKRLPDSDKHIFKCPTNKNVYCVTNEWFAGTFAGRSFESENYEYSAQQLIDYMYEHIGHDSIVGGSVTKSGFPDLVKVFEYCNSMLNAN